MIKSNVKNSLINLMYLCLVIFYEEVIFSISTIGIMGNVTLKLLFTIIISLVILTIIQLCSPKISKKIFSIVLCIMPIIFCIYHLYYSLFGQVLSIYSILAGTQALQFTATILNNVINNWYWIVLILLPMIIYFGMIHKKIYIESIEVKNVITYIVILACVYGLSIGFIHILAEEDDIYSAKNIYYNVNNPMKSLENFGLFTTIRLDIQRMITNFQDEHILTIVNENGEC